MGDGDGGLTLPANMTEEEVIEIVRELLGDEDMTDTEMMAAYRTGMFQELCPDIALYAKQKNKPVKMKVEPSTSRPVKVEPSTSRPVKVDASASRPVKVEASTSRPSEKSSKSVETSSKPSESRIQTVCISDSESASRHSHHKKKKKKKHKHHKDDKHRDDRDDKHRKDKDDKHHRDKNDKPHRVKEEKDKKEETSVKVEAGSSGQPSTKEVKREETGEREKKKEPKPFSKYNSTASHIKIRRWNPVLDREHSQHETTFGLKPMSIVCLDLLDLPIVFHHPYKGRKQTNSLPLTSNLELTDTQESMIRRLERDKLSWFKGVLTRRVLKSTKPSSKRGRMSSSSSSDEDTDRKPKRYHRIVSDSDSSDLMVPVASKKAKMSSENRKDRDRGGTKLSKADRDAESRKRKYEEISKKAKELAKRLGTQGPAATRDIKQIKKKHEDPKDKQKAEERRKKLKIQEAKIQKQKLASHSFQRILAQIEAANKEEAKKPIVELKIPKLSEKAQPRALGDEYKIERKINVGDVAKEVNRLLKSNVKVEMPVMPDNSEDLGEYTVKKIAWWILKNEKDPPDQGMFHPELHDDDDMESIHADDFDWPSDMSSINGCVSDPEGLAGDILPDPKKVNDPDWADDYCGEASLYAKMRRDHDKVTDLETPNTFKAFLRIKPGTNYEKSNFEVKCFLCNELIKGQRQLGAHIRSNSHKNNFRNYSLNIGNYEENVVRAVPKKEFVAQLVEYSVNANGSTTQKIADISEVKKHHVGKIERVRSDSPGPIIAGDTAGNIEVHAVPIPDDISLPSIEDFDISSDESLMNVRVVIRTTGRWNDDLERRWRAWRDEEAKIAEGYNVDREWFINEPEKHPNYQDEWMKFWEKRVTELEDEGKDTENYNFHKEWMPFWLKRMQEIMKAQVEERVHELKNRYKIDKFTLRKMYQISPEATKRKKTKKKTGKIGQENSSSLKSSAKVESNDPHPVYHKTAPLLPHQTQQPQHKRDHQHHHSSSHHHRSYHNVHKNHAPAPDGRRHVSSGGNRGQIDRSSTPKQTFKAMNESTVRRESQELDNITPVNSDIDESSNSNEKSQHNNSLKVIKSVCSNVSSAEPLPPGDDTFPDQNKTRPFQNPVLSKPRIDEMKQNAAKDLKELRQKQEHSVWNNNSSKSDKRLDRKDREKDNSDSRNSNSKHVTTNPSSDNTADNSNKNWKKDRDSDNDSSASGNARALQSSLQALREALANEESINSTGRPKIKPVDKPEKKLEDGEVASDVSSAAEFNPGLQGVSTFINKSIPGLTPETRIPAISTENLNKNSLGYHLLERRKSADQQQPNSHNHTGRPKFENDRHASTSKGHSSKHENKKRNKHYRGPKSHHPDFHRSKKGADNRNEKWQHRNNKQGGYHNKGHNPPAYNNNSNINVPSVPPVQEENWEQEESWEPTTAENPWQPSPAAVPESGNVIPVLTATRDPQPYNAPPTYQPEAWENSEQHWDSWGQTNYPPQVTDPNNYYR